MSWWHERARNGGVDEIPVRPAGGRLWLAGKHFVGPDPQASLTAVGASQVVCLCEAHELDRYPAYVEWLRANAPERARWWPIPDLHGPSVSEAERLVGDLRASLDAGAGVLMHCGAGIGRAGTFATALLIDLGRPLDEALAIVASHRPMAGPEAGGQRALLVELAARRAR